MFSYIFEKVIKLIYQKELCITCNFIDDIIVRERNFLFYFKEFIFHMTTIHENAVKISKKNVKLSVLQS